MTQKAATSELLLHFLIVCAQTLQDGRTLYSKKSYVFCLSILTVFDGEMTPQDWQQNLIFMGKLINNLKELDVIEANVKKKIRKAQLL